MLFCMGILRRLILYKSFVQHSINFSGEHMRTVVFEQAKLHSRYILKGAGIKVTINIRREIRAIYLLVGSIGISQ